MHSFIHPPASHACWDSKRVSQPAHVVLRISSHIISDKEKYLYPGDTLMINFSIVIIGHIICCIKLQTSLAHYHHTKNAELGSNEEEQTRQIQRMGHFLKIPFQGSEREKDLGVAAHTFNPELERQRQRQVNLLVQGQPGLYNKFLDSVSYTVRPCVCRQPPLPKKGRGQEALSFNIQSFWCDCINWRMSLRETHVLGWNNIYSLFYTDGLTTMWVCYSEKLNKNENSKPTLLKILILNYTDKFNYIWVGKSLLLPLEEM